MHLFFIIPLLSRVINNQNKTPTQRRSERMGARTRKYDYILMSCLQYPKI